MYVGVGRANITPRVGGHLAGYGWDVFSKSIHDDLTATALAIKTEEKCVVLVSATVCILDEELVAEVRGILCKKYSFLCCDDIMIAATHTHSGPYSYSTVGWGSKDIAYCEEIFVPNVVKAVEAAIRFMVPAEMGVGETQSRVGVNRRQLGPEGAIDFGQNPWAMYDPTMTVVAFRSEAGKPIANLVHYGCHGTAAGTNTEITRDWPGVMIDRLEAESGAVTMFFNGTAGDVGPRLTNGKTKGDIHYVEELGAVAAMDAVRAYRMIRTYRQVWPETVSGEIRLPLSPMLSREEAAAGLERYRQLPKTNVHQRMADYYQKVLNAYLFGFTAPKEVTLPVTLLRLGDLVLAPLGFEVFCEIGLRLRAYSPYAHTLIVGYANTKSRYFPSQDQICRGGYEIMMSRTADVCPYAPDADDYLIRGLLAMIDRL